VFCVIFEAFICHSNRGSKLEEEHEPSAASPPTSPVASPAQPSKATTRVNSKGLIDEQKVIWGEVATSRTGEGISVNFASAKKPQEKADIVLEAVVEEECYSLKADMKLNNAQMSFQD